jgi:hypothetical protein
MAPTAQPYSQDACKIVSHVFATLGLAEVAETLADLYKGKISLPRVNSLQEPFASHQDIQRNTPNTRRTNQYLERIETPMKYSFPHITTE